MGSGSHDSPADIWLGGFMVFWMVAGGLVGGVVASVILASSSHMGDAIKQAPLLLAWVTLVAASGALSWAGLIPSAAAGWRSWRQVSPRSRVWIVSTVVAIITVITLSSILEPRAYPLDVKWPLLEDQNVRMQAVTAFVLVPPLFAVVAMWLTAVEALERLPAGTAKPMDIARFLQLRDRLQSLLWYVGVVIGCGVLATGTLRQSMLDGKDMTAEAYPPSLVLAYGAFFTLLLIVSYVPAYLLVRHAGDRMIERFGDQSDVLKWQEDRKKLVETLGLEIGLEDSLKNTIAILAPIVAGLASVALPK